MLARMVVAVLALSVGCGCLAQAESKRCAVEHPRAENGTTIAAKMSVLNDGRPCAMRMRLGGREAMSVTIRSGPTSGTLSTTEGSLSYTPNPGFSGHDFFDVQWFGVGFGPNSRSHNLRTKVDVTVRQATDEPDGLGDEPQTKSDKPGR